jgi:glycerol-3-phosphate dehydrogenase
MASRRAMWDRLAEPVDVLVVGGGITGAGIARDAAMRGLRVALVEMRDLAYGTSSRSSKLVHGGLRYLEMYEFNLVFEAVSERRVLLDIAPHLVAPLPFLFPVYQKSRQKLWLVNTGMWLYDGLSMFRATKLHKNLGAKEVERLEPMLAQHELVGAPLYYDCATDDARLTLENALDAVRRGATVVTHARVTGFTRDAQGRLDGAEVRDELTGEVRRVRAGCVVNASGPWTDAVLGLRGEARAKPLLRPTKGVHIVVERHRLPVQNAVVCFHPSDGRVLFAIPWGDRTYVGTTDTDFDGDPAEVCATGADVRYLLDAANAYFPDVQLAGEDVVSTWAGLRPLVRPPDGVGESATSREHEVHVTPDGLVTIAGGKLTTYRRMAAEVVDKAVQVLQLTGRRTHPVDPSRTDREALPGAVGWPEDDDVATLVAHVVEVSGRRIPRASAELLVRAYGSRALDLGRRVSAHPELAQPLVPGRHEILAQVDLAVDEELAVEVDDVLVRRTQIFFRDHDQGLGCADVVARRLGQRQGWDDARIARSADTYRAEVARSRRWRIEG